MCGIVGIIGPVADRHGPAAIDLMVGTLVHRGPDDQGVWRGQEATLAFRRLSIIDLSGGHQPYISADGRYIWVINGEIYNHRALRAELIAKGHSFRTDHADGEVIGPLFIEYGLSFLEHLQGMFAIAIWDTHERQLVIARDHIGIKPLFFAQVAGGVIFASEIKAILKHPQISRREDRQALNHYFSFKHIPAPHTAFDGIRQLRAGECMVWQAGEATFHRWWQWPNGTESAETEEALAEELLRLLEISVQSHLESDVEVGAYLSGGLDSSAVATLAARYSSKRIKTFTLVYPGGIAGKDADRDFARLVSSEIGSEHYELELSPKTAIDRIDEVVGAFDEPFSGVISTFFLSEMIAKHVRVALSGDGADELFASYLPHRLATPLENLAHGNMAISGEFSEQTLRGILARGDEAARRMAQYLNDDKEKLRLLVPSISASGLSSEALVRSLYAQLATKDPVNRALAIDIETMLPDQVLAFVDRLSMAHSLEVRPPFLSRQVLEFAARVPGTAKIKDGQVKYILKKALRGTLPSALIDRPKEGFLMPINDWLLGDMWGWIQNVLSPARLARHDLLNVSAVQQLLAQHHQGDKVDRKRGDRIWNLAMFQLWWEKHFN